MKWWCQVFATTAVFVGGLDVQSAEAQEDFPAVTDRDYAIDLYSGNALGSNEIVSMGGAAVALASGSSGMIVNPAASAVRPQTSNHNWDWSFHFDALAAVAGNDFDNNGIEDQSTEDLRPQVTFGIVGNYKTWALGISGSFISIEADAPSGAEIEVSGSAIQIQLAKALFRDQVIAGIGIRGGGLEVDAKRGETLFDLTTIAIEGGVVWAPSKQPLRVGAAVTLPATGDEVNVSACDPVDCEGLILPDQVAVPWSAIVGIAWRRAPTPWNQKDPRRFMDERRLTLAADLRVTGSVRDGYGISQFSKGRLQRSGDRLAISGRFGAEYEWLPGRLRVRGGSYWEPSRFRDPSGDGVRGRLHLTAGADLRLFTLNVFSRAYRPRLSFTFDGAENYINSGLSIGLWW